MFNLTSSNHFAGHHQAASGGVEEHRRGWKSLHVLHWLVRLHWEQLHGANWHFWTSWPGRHGEEDEKTRGIELFTRICAVLVCSHGFTATALNLNLSGRHLDTRCSVALNTPPWTGCNKSVMAGWWVRKPSVCSGEFDHKLVWVQYPSQQKKSLRNLFSAKWHPNLLQCTDFVGSYNMHEVFKPFSVSILFGYSTNWHSWKSLSLHSFCQMDFGPAQTCTDRNKKKISTATSFAWHSSYREDRMSMCVSIRSLWRQSGGCFTGSVVAGRDLPLGSRGWRSAGVRSLLAQTL